MSTKVAEPSRWFTGWRFAERVPQTDPADLGTAFGLDMSLDPDWAATPQVAAPVARPPGWVRRLTTRRRPAA